MARAWTYGERVPSFSGRTTQREKFHFDTIAGRYIVLSLIGSAGIEKNAAAFTHMMRHRFDDDFCTFFAISIDAGDRELKRLGDREPGVRTFWDMDHRISRLFGAIEEGAPGQAVIYTPSTLILDPNLRVITQILMNDAEQHNTLFDQAMAALKPLNDYAGVPIHAPVLVVPRVFEPEFCRTLIDEYHRNGGQDSGFMREVNGKTVGVYDYSFKRRSDYFFDHDRELTEQVRRRIVRRLVPEIKRAFDFNVTRMERHVISCYEAETQGFFRPHRDNTTPATAHRRFACSLNLNAEEYDGGDLRFPEFGTHTYRAPTGGAVVFSCTLLHEATHVTRGVRYAFLPFFYDEAAAQIRQENLENLSDQIIDNRATGAA